MRCMLVVVLVALIGANLARSAGPPNGATWQRFLQIEQVHREEARGWALLRMGKREQAEQTFEAVLKAREQLYPQGHADLVDSIDTLGFLARQKGDLAGARRLYGRALDLNRKLYPGDRFPLGHPDLAMSLSNLGVVLEQLGEPLQALEHQRQALVMRKKIYSPEHFPQGHPDLAVSLNNVGSVLWAQGEPAQAVVYLRQALEMRQQLYSVSRFPMGHPDLAHSLNNLGSVLKSLGEPAQALEFCQQGLEMRQKLYPESRYPEGHADLASSLNNMGSVLSALGEPTKALSYYRQALEMRQKLFPASRYKHGHPDVARSLNNLGFVLDALGEPEQAAEYFRQALEMRRKLHPFVLFPQGHQDLARSLNNLGTAMEATGKLALALEYHRQALEMYQKLYPVSRFPDGHPELATSMNNIGCLLRMLGEPAKALGYHRLAHEMDRKLYPVSRYPDGHPSLACSLHNLGAVLDALGERGQALVYFRQALQMVRNHQLNLALASDETAALNHATTLPLVRDALLSVSIEVPDSQPYPLIWDTRAALSRLHEFRHLGRLASTGRAREVFAELVALRRQRQGLLLAATAANPADRDRRLADLATQIAAGERQLRTLLPEREGFDRVSRATPADLQKVLPENTVFIDLLHYIRFQQDRSGKGGKGERHTPSYLAFLVTRDRITRVELGEAGPIDEAIGQWRRSISGGGSGDKLAQQLRRLVWEPIAAHLPVATRTIYLAPDLALCSLPWPALPEGMGVLLERYTLIQVPHGPFVLERLTRPRRPAEGKPTLLAMGGVAHDSAPTRLVAGLRGLPGESLKWDPLPGTWLEVEQLSKLAVGLDVHRLEGKDAGVQALLDELPRRRYAHLATHGFFAHTKFRSALQLDPKLFASRILRPGSEERIGAGARSPLLLSGLVCAGANRPETADRGIVTADAIAQLDLRGLELAVLSACETGLGQTAGGEGVFGLQRAFHIAGTRNVIASLWKVDDEATVALMTLFYQNLWHADKKQTPAEALREAQLALYRNPDRIKEWAAFRGVGKPIKLAAPRGKTAPPHLWAGFVLSGLGD